MSGENDHQDIQVRMEELRKRMEIKRGELTEAAEACLAETGRLSDPKLCVMDREFEDISAEYTALAERLKKGADEENTEG